MTQIEKYIERLKTLQNLYQEGQPQHNAFGIAIVEANEMLVKNCSIPDVSKRLKIGSKVCMIAHKNITGKVVDRSDVGFNHWMVKWDRTGETVREYGNDLVVC